MPTASKLKAKLGAKREAKALSRKGGGGGEELRRRKAVCFQTRGIKKKETKTSLEEQKLAVKETRPREVQ